MTAAALAMPRLGLGTWLRHDEDGYRAILTGIELGYRHIDTAQTYGTESHVGRALRAGGLRRDELFITTKVGDVNLAKRDFLPSVEQSLARIGVDAVDLLLIHWPSSKDAVPFESYIHDLAEVKARGMTRAIGVSNFPCALVARAAAILGSNQMTTNQVEVHPYLQNHPVRTCCASHGMIVTAYMPLAGGRVTTDPVIGRIAAKHGESPATVTLAWLLARGMAAIPASGRRDHMAANLRALDLRLDEDDLAAIDARDRGERLIDPAKSPAWDRTEPSHG
jgi:2,5-diketo-D-gluconate reductase B